MSLAYREPILYNIKIENEIFYVRLCVVEKIPIVEVKSSVSYKGT